MSKTASTSCALLLSIATIARAGHAQDVPLTIRSPAGAAIEIRTRRKELVGQCIAPCTLMLPTGKYLLGAAKTDDTTGGTDRITVDGPSTADVAPGSLSDRQFGLGLGIVGSSTAMASFVILSFESLAEHRRSLGAALGAACVGGALAAIGWSMFAHANGPTVSITPNVSTTAWRPLTTFAGATATVRLAF